VAFRRISWYQQTKISKKPGDMRLRDFFHKLSSYFIRSAVGVNVGSWVVPLGKLPLGNLCRSGVSENESAATMQPTAMVAARRPLNSSPLTAGG